MQVILASASPARLSVLRAAGLDPLVEVSDVDEDAVLDSLPGASPAHAVTALARAKAHAVARRLGSTNAVLIGCDSMLSIGGELVGKPGTVEVARARWARMAGRTGELVTGHAVLRLSAGDIVDEAAAHAGTTVRFGSPSEAELDAYLNSGEPLAVAGAFTLDGLGGWFVDGIDGDPSTVIGISLPLTRTLLAKVGVVVTDLWKSRD
ncbi:Maf family protein [Pseudonocardia spinosispora]|uniref:Maf family protein n=1 Tax=Pseudonocardia spinosispora TaxID=103441 RepID=UPI00040E819B|nr:Maf family protein [Pseudonocardia spinosispora]